MKAVLVGLAVLLSFFVLVIASGLFWSWGVSRSPLQREFLNGRVPNQLPDGFYQGKIGIMSSWTGEQFDGEHKTGMNVFRGRDTFSQYPFRMEVGKALVDKNKTVLRLDYNVPKNLPWARFVLGEMVETRPGHFLGKVHVRIIPLVPLTLGYFELEKSEE